MRWLLGWALFFCMTNFQRSEADVESGYRSLWLEGERRSWPALQGDCVCDTAIVGGGISGVATLYYLLTETNQKVALVERNRIASGATGNNGGLPTVYIERPIGELVEEFGLAKTEETFREMAAAHSLLEEIHAAIGFSENLCPLDATRIGLRSVPELVSWWEKNDIFFQLSSEKWSTWVVDDPAIRASIPLEMRSSIRWVSREEMAGALKRKKLDYVALTVRERHRVRMNSAAFCDRALCYLKEKFPDRCAIYEETEILRVNLTGEGTVLPH